MGKQARGREGRTRQSWAARCVLYIARESSRRAWEDRIHEERRMRKRRREKESKYDKGKLRALSR